MSLGAASEPLMYGLVKHVALRLLKAPAEPPEPPAGSHDSIEIYRASPAYLRYRLVGWAIVTGLMALLALSVALVAIVEGEVGPIVTALALGVAVTVAAFVGYFAVRIDYELRYYIVTDRSLRVRQGAIVVKEMTITHANVQNLRVVQGPLLRLFGISNLIVETAGGGAAAAKGESAGGGHSILMAGIENAHVVRDLILRHLRARGGGTGLGDPDDDDRVPASAELAVELRAVQAAAAGLRRAAEAR